MARDEACFFIRKSESFLVWCVGWEELITEVSECSSRSFSNLLLELRLIGPWSFHLCAKGGANPQELGLRAAVEGLTLNH